MLPLRLDSIDSDKHKMNFIHSSKQIRFYFGFLIRQIPMARFKDKNDTLSSFNSSEVIEVSDDEDDSELSEENEKDIDDDSESISSSDEYDGKFRAAKRFKKMIADENSFKFNVMKILKQSCEVAGDFVVSGKLHTTPLIAIMLKVKCQCCKKS